jgi:PIN domain nuclease of toxin-antitoxin system
MTALTGLARGAIRIEELACAIQAAQRVHGDPADVAQIVTTLAEAIELLARDLAVVLQEVADDATS